MFDLIPFEGIISSSATMREKIMQFEEALMQLPGASQFTHESFPVTHSFADGLYIRELFIPKGGCLTGRIHRHSHLSFLMQGDITIISEEGVHRLKAPHMVIAPAGTKRIGFAHEDTRWVTVHATKETNIEQIEAFLAVGSYDQFEKEQACLS